jgi:hypothetical protein
MRGPRSAPPVGGRRRPWSASGTTSRRKLPLPARPRAAANRSTLAATGTYRSRSPQMASTGQVTRSSTGTGS